MQVYTLTSPGGLAVEVLDHGGIIRALRVPDRDGRIEDVVLGLDEPAAYVENPAYFGALIGRYANRIARGRFSIDGAEHRLATNEPPHHLHGGRRGFDAVTWRAEPVRDRGGDGLVLRYTSPDGEEGYPGTLRVRVRYTVTPANELVVEYHATADRPTPVNLTQHSYFNLGGPGSAHVLDHVLEIPADRFVPVDGTQIPTGELRPVAGTPFDFRTPRPIGERLHHRDEQLGIGGGYDHSYVVRAAGGPGPRLAARVRDPGSGRVLEVRTTEPGIQLYTGNGLDGVAGKDGRPYVAHAGVALETQHFPDSPNQPHFPSTILRPGGSYESLTVYAFTTDD
ncbi:MAG: aldose epimerase family protein [Gemmatimonadota bacterium]